MLRLNILGFRFEHANLLNILQFLKINKNCCFLGTTFLHLYNITEYIFCQAFWQNLNFFKTKFAKKGMSSKTHTLKKI